jgi:lipopolysaccharide/colanic/teichoic acid biosynthesis glycosyltransferase
MSLSLFLMVLLSPLFILVAAAVKLDSEGPALFSQSRLGINGEIFSLLKFRSMRVGLENDRAHAGSRNDPRITRVGRVIRRFRIDELPQIWNVFKGEMSFVGPRALMEEEVDVFQRTIPFFSIRHAIRPGITGWAQINYPHGASEEDALAKLEYDLYYLKNLSPILDIVILLKTIRTVLLGKGAR